MDTKDCLKEELKRLNRRNDLLEEELNQKVNIRLDIEEQIKNNALAMCEIAKACRQCL